VVNRTGAVAAARMAARGGRWDPPHPPMLRRALATAHPLPAAEVLWLGDPRAADPALAGDKAAALSRLAAGHRVPPGFVLSLSGATPDRSARAAVADAYRTLAERCGVADPPVVVRSSAVDEDGADASFDGRHDSVLGVAGAEQVWWAISRCAASLGDERAVAYRRRAGLPDAPRRAAVLVQWLVPADAAGVVFSANPITGARDVVLVNAAWGLGESIASGSVSPDLVVVDRATLALRGHVVADKHRMTVPLPGGVREVPVPARLARMPAIDDAQARAAAALAIALERETGRAVEVEVAWAGADLFLLRCRAMTTPEATASRP
jgi:phosphoenolpyruvate synthase/pyruvate phosphate dikinase